MRIVLDAMGTDAHPQPDVGGAILAIKEYGDSIILTGDKTRIQRELAKHQAGARNIEIVHADDEITMEDKPGFVLKHKPSSSMHVGMSLVKNGEADAFVTMGNTGAAHAIATLSALRRIPGVKRPALSGVYPIQGKNRIFLDVGANTDSKPEWLAQFAIMGSIYAEKAFGIANPAVGLLSNGEEFGKGDRLVQEAYREIERLGLHFLGNIEPRDLLSGEVDVVVFDGFVGNIFVKTIESGFAYMGEVLREELMGSLTTKIAAFFLRSAFLRARKRLNTSEVGGAPLLGVNGVVIIGHGRSDANAVMNAIRQARLAVAGNTIECIRAGLQETIAG